MRRPRFDISHKFIGYLVFLSVIPLLIVGIVSYHTSSSIIASETSHYTMQLVINQRDYLDLQLEQVESLISNISGVEEIREVVEDENATTDTYTSLTTQARIGYILNGYSNLRGLVSIDIFTAGDVHYHVGDTLNVDEIRTDIRDKIFAEALHTEQQVVWIGIEDNVNANSGNVKVVPAAKILYKVNRDTLQQEPVALFLVNYSVEYLYDHLSGVDLGENAYMMVIDDKGRIIYHPDISMIGDQSDADLEQLGTSQSGTMLRSLGNDDMSISFVRSDISNWTILGLIPLDTLAAKSATIQEIVLGVLVVCFVAVGVIGWVYNRNVVKPIRLITQRFKSIQPDSTNTKQSYVPVQGSDEIAELSQWFNTFMDVLATRQEAEQQRLELAVERERVQILANFITDASHEFKTPLSIINTNAHLLKRITDPDRHNQRVQNIEQEVANITKLIDSLTLMSRLDGGGQEFTFSEIDMNEVIRSTFHGAQLAFKEKTITCVLELSDDLALIQGDLYHIQYAVKCIWENAIQNTAPNGTVEARSCNDEDSVVVEIIDTGAGIQARDLPHIFKRFYRSDKAGTTRGFGLGLPVSDAIIKLHHGCIEVESAVGKGSTFRIKLPITQPEKRH